MPAHHPSSTSHSLTTTLSITCCVATTVSPCPKATYELLRVGASSVGHWPYPPHEQMAGVADIDQFLSRTHTLTHPHEQWQSVVLHTIPNQQVWLVLDRPWFSAYAYQENSSVLFPDLGFNGQL